MKFGILRTPDRTFVVFQFAELKRPGNNNGYNYCARGWFAGIDKDWVLPSEVAKAKTFKSFEEAYTDLHPVFCAGHRITQVAYFEVNNAEEFNLFQKAAKDFSHLLKAHT